MKRIKKVLALFLIVCCVMGSITTAFAAEGMQIDNTEKLSSASREDAKAYAKNQEPLPVGEIGIDVSSHQGDIDWEQVAASGIRFVYIRATTWDKDNWTNGIDTNFEKNVRGAWENGIQIGLYHYTYATTIDSAKREIDFLYNSPEMQSLLADGIKITLPVYVDFEYESLPYQIGTNQARSAIILTEMEKLEEYGFKTGYYTYDAFATCYLDMSMLEGYDFWLANYHEAYSDTYSPVMWQYTHQGSVPGISTEVDMNIIER